MANGVINIDYIEKLEKFILEHGLKCYKTSSVHKVNLFCNGFIIKYNSGEFIIEQTSGKKFKRTFTSVEAAYNFIAEGFVNKTSHLHAQLKVILRKRHTRGEINKAIIEIRKLYKVIPMNRARLFDLMYDHMDKPTTWISKEIMAIFEDKEDKITLREAVDICKDKIPEIPKWVHCDIPLNPSQLLNGAITVRDFFLLNVFYEYPPMLYYAYKSREIHKQVLIPSKKKKKLGSGKWNLELYKTYLEKNFWEKMREERKDSAFKCVIKLLHTVPLKKTIMVGRGTHILKEIALFYGLKNINTEYMSEVYVHDLIKLHKGGYEVEGLRRDA